MMNERAAEIGMTRTCFVTPSGLEGEGHGSSAFDMALLAREALRNKTLQKSAPSPRQRLFSEIPRMNDGLQIPISCSPCTTE